MELTCAVLKPLAPTIEDRISAPATLVFKGTVSLALVTNFIAQLKM